MERLILSDSKGVNQGHIESRDQTQISHVQDKHPSNCTITADLHHLLSPYCNINAGSSCSAFGKGEKRRKGQTEKETMRRTNVSEKVKRRQEAEKLRKPAVWSPWGLDPYRVPHALAQTSLQSHWAMRRSQDLPGSRGRNNELQGGYLWV